MLKHNTDMKKSIWIGTSCFSAYASCYVGRNILSAMMPQIIKENIFTSEALGSMGGSFFFTYGLGQLINGIIGNKVSPKIMVAIGLFISGLIILMFPSCQSSQLGILLWGACGFMYSMLWGPISKMVAENTSHKTAKILLTSLSVASIIGTLITYILALYSSMSHSWKVGFYIAGSLSIVTSILWFIANIHMEKSGIIKHNLKQNKDANNNIFNMFLNISFISMVIVTMLNGVIRNAVAFWIPTFISEKLGIKLELVASISIILPFINIIGTFTSVYALRYVKDNEIRMCAFLFAIATAMFTLIFILNGRLAILTIIALFIASAVMTGASNMIFSTYVLRFRKQGMISGVTGFLDFSSYMSASIASIVFTRILNFGDWNTVVVSWFIVTFTGIIFSLLANKRQIVSD